MYWILCAVLLFFTIERCLSVAPQLYSNVDESRSCEVTNLHFWRLINWFFERTTYVIISAILGTNLTKADTATTFIQELSKSKYCSSNLILKQLDLNTNSRCSIYHFD